MQLLIIPTAKPLLAGIYDQNVLIQSWSKQGQLSNSLVPLFSEICKHYEPHSLFFIRGPGNFMALKLMYLFAQTLAITKSIKLYATHGFHFNHASPIKAYGHCYFVLDQNQEIILQTYQTPPKINDYALPKQLNPNLFSQQIEPLYLLPAL